jgi:hypothetical protein|tara:strand:+ start:268 stop:498 length:231 start_codon:yes stop_codon:yes gene_type:complete
MILKKGDTVFLSQLGSKGFYYPTQERETLISDVDAQPLHWIGCNEKRAVLIPANSIYALSSSERKTAVWIERDKSY